MDLRAKLHSLGVMSREHLRQAQENQKRLYDRGTRLRDLTGLHEGLLADSVVASSPGENGVLHSARSIPIQGTSVRVVRGPSHVPAADGPGAATSCRICCRLPRRHSHLWRRLGAACAAGGGRPSVAETGGAHGQPEEVRDRAEGDPVSGVPPGAGEG